MEILGIGVPEIGFLVLLALILLGPRDMVKAGQALGRGLRKLVMSPTWRAMQATGKELQELPTKLMREAGLDEIKELEKQTRDSLKKDLSPFNSIENVILSSPPPPQPVQPANPPVPAPGGDPATPSQDSPEIPASSN